MNLTLFSGLVLCTFAVGVVTEIAAAVVLLGLAAIGVVRLTNRARAAIRRRRHHTPTAGRHARTVDALNAPTHRYPVITDLDDTVVFHQPAYTSRRVL